MEGTLEDPKEREKKIHQVFEEQDIPTTQLLDHRTAQILEDYLFYRSAPHLGMDNRVWKESVIILNHIFEQRLF